MGHSGSGKSTLMNILGCLDRPTLGHYYLDGVDTAGMTPDQLSDIRNRKIGFVFQSFNLISRTSALKNVELPMTYARISRSRRTERAKELLTRVGLGGRMNHLPMSFRAASASGWPSQGRLPMNLPFFWPMSPQETWIQLPPLRSWSCLRSFTGKELRWCW